jgi:hypothetical protein
MLHRAKAQCNQAGDRRPLGDPSPAARLARHRSRAGVAPYESIVASGRDRRTPTDSAMRRPPVARRQLARYRTQELRRLQESTMRRYRKVSATIAFSIVVVLALASLNTAALWLVRSQYAVNDTFSFMSMTPYSTGSSFGGVSDPQLQLADAMRARQDGPAGVPIVVD